LVKSRNTSRTLLLEPPTKAVLFFKQKLEDEINRFNQFKNTVMGMTEAEKAKERKPDIRTYAKYLLKEGTLQEKRDLMQSFKSRLILLNKRIILE
jgi:hypothetical protein